MSTASTIQRTTALSLIAAIATPAMAASKAIIDPPAIVRAASATNGALVKHIKFTINGREAYAIFGAIPAESTRTFVEAVSKVSPDNITLGVKNADDPLLNDLNGVNLNPKNVVAIDDDVTKVSGVMFEKDVELKQRFLTKLKAMGNEVKTKRWNTMAAFGYSGTVSIGQVYVMSGSLSNAAMTFVPISTLALFAATQSSYGQLLNATGKGAESIVAKTWKAAGIGKEMPEIYKRYSRAAGQFIPIYAASVGSTALVTHMSNQHIEFHHLMIQAFANNYAVWDAVVARAISTHLLPHTFEMPYFLAQYVGFTGGELAAYQGVPGVEIGMAIISGVGLFWLANGQYIEDAILRANLMLRWKMDGDKAKILASSIPELRRRLTMMRLARQIAGGSTKDCELGLAKVGAKVSPWTPSSWRPGIRSLDN